MTDEREAMNYEATIQPSDADVRDPVIASDDTERASGRRKLWIGLAIALLVGAALVAYQLFAGEGDAADTAAAEGGAESAPVISVMMPGRQDVVRTINATGTIAARREIPVGVVGEGGRVVRVFVDAGDWVRSGQVMASIDRSVQNQQVAGLEAQIAAAQADVNLAQSNLDRAMQLVDRGFISKADIDRLTATRDANRARLRVAQAQVNEARARNNRLSIVAPTGGYVLSRSVEPGQTVTQGSGTLFTLAQGGDMEMNAQLSEVDLAAVSVGVAAEVSPVGTDTTLEGRIWQIAPTIDAASRLGTARIALGYDPALRPGGFASARIRSGSAVGALLPESAVLNDAKGSYVYIVDGDNQVVRRDVEVGDVTANGLAISSGLTGGERVVLRAGGFLNPGQTVKPNVVKRGQE